MLWRCQYGTKLILMGSTEAAAALSLQRLSYVRQQFCFTPLSLGGFSIILSWESPISYSRSQFIYVVHRFRYQIIILASLLCHFIISAATI